MYMDYQQINEMLMDACREQIKKFDGELNLTSNNYGFCTAWLEDDEVWWDKDLDHMDSEMSETTELSALLDTILKTEKELEDEKQ